MAISNLGMGSSDQAFIDGAAQSSGFGGKQSMYDPNNQTHAQAARDLRSAIEGMISSGNESGAKDLYNQKQSQFGFTDAEFSPFALNGAGDGTFSPDQINSWKQNTAPAPTPQGGTFVENNPGLNAPQVDPYKKNPYLDDMAQGIQSQMNDNWTRSQLPSIRSGAMAAGGFGGSRQGVVEANGLNDMNRSLGQNLTSLYGGDYQQTQNRNLQKYGMDQSYNLGMANNNLGYAGLDAGIYNNNFNNQLNSAKFGLDAYGMMMNQGNLGINSAQTIQNTPMNYNNYFAGQYTNAGGLGGSSTQQMPGNPALGFLGGAQLANSIKF